jgi:hypothetical protein
VVSLCEASNARIGHTHRLVDSAAMFRHPKIACRLKLCCMNPLFLTVPYGLLYGYIVVMDCFMELLSVTVAFDQQALRILHRSVFIARLII